MNNSDNVENFVKSYIEAWSVKDPVRRRELINETYTSNADFYADEPGDGPVECHGLDAIDANITQVNRRLVQSKGLITELVGFSANHDALHVSWRMMTADGNLAMAGMNFLFRDVTGKISRDYIFIG